jgi:hypothetical protein
VIQEVQDHKDHRVRQEQMVKMEQQDLKVHRVQPAQKEQPEQQDLKVHRVHKDHKDLQEQMVAVIFSLTVNKHKLLDKIILQKVRLHTCK